MSESWGSAQIEVDSDPEDGEDSQELIEHMDIREPLYVLRDMLQNTIGISLEDFSFYLQDNGPLDINHHIADQCLQEEDLVQINCVINLKHQQVRIVDILKPAEDALDTKPPKTYRSPRIKHSLAAANKNWAIDNAFKRNQTLLRIPNNPSLWKRHHVQYWIKWAMRHFTEASINPEDWNMTGKQLDRLSIDDFNQLVTEDPGNFFWTHFELLRKCKYVAVQKSDEGKAAAVAVSETKSSIGATAAGALATPPQEKKARLSEPKTDVDYYMNMSSSFVGTGTIQLWQFLLELLTDAQYLDIICWEKEEGEFRFIDAERVAKLWGIRKNKSNMNYEKLSRALRYYYDGDMLAKITGRRFVYKFVCRLEDLVGYTSKQLAKMVQEVADCTS